MGNNYDKVIEDEYELIDYLEYQLKNDDLDIVVYVNTGWQSLGAGAKLNEYDEQRSGAVIMRGPIDKNGYQQKETFESTIHDFEYILISDFGRGSFIERTMHYMKRLYNYFRIPNPSCNRNVVEIITKHRYASLFNLLFVRNSINKEYSPKYVLCDAGFDEYIPNKMFLGNIKLKYVYELLDEILQEHMLNEHAIDRRRLFEYDNGKLELNEPILHSYQAILSQKGSKKVREALILTTPHKVLGITEHKWMATVNEIVQDLLDMGLSVKIKPHPKEDAHKYKEVASNELVNIVSEDTGAERLLQNYQPFCVIGHTSTALLTLPAIYNVKSYTFTGSSKYGLDSNLSKYERIFLTATADLISSIDEINHTEFKG